MRAARPRCFVVVGTGTGVGKTVVASLLAAELFARGARVAVSKPLASGCRRQGRRLVSDDALSLVRAVGEDDLAAHDRACPWRAVAPLAPGLALRSPPTVAAVLRHVRERAKGADAIVFEGAGGLLLPYAKDGTVLDVVARLCATTSLDARVVLVGASSLGTINHTCLSVAALRSRGIEPAAMVLSRMSRAKAPDEASNPRAIARLLRAQAPLVLPFLGGARDEARARALLARAIVDA